MNLVTLDPTYKSTSNNGPCDLGTGQPSKFHLSDLAVRQGSALTGQDKIDFELMLACAIFDEPKCQNCLAKGKPLNPGHC